MEETDNLPIIDLRNLSVIDLRDYFPSCWKKVDDKSEREKFSKLVLTTFPDDPKLNSFSIKRGLNKESIQIMREDLTRGYVFVKYPFTEEERKKVVEAYNEAGLEVTKSIYLSLQNVWAFSWITVGRAKGANLNG